MNLGIETETIEYKRSTAELDDAIDSIVAILNKHNKGTLYFGIKNDGEIIGQQVSDKTLRDISQAIGNHIEPKIFPEINLVIMDEKEVVEVKFEGYNTPYLSFGKAKIRSADEDLPMSRNELVKLAKESVIDETWEKQISKYDLSKVNSNELKKYVDKAKKVKRINFDYIDDKTSLDKLELIEGNRLLNASMVLFSESIYSDLQMAVFATDQRLTFLDIDRKRGNLFDLVNTAEDYIKRNINWRVEFDGSLERKEIPEIPIEAVREAILNSFCHKDYSTSQSNEVSVYKDRVEIYNPGAFPAEYKPEDYIKEDLRPIRRNPLITSILYYSKDVEGFGTGLKRIADLCKETNCKYEFEKQKYGFVVKFYRTNLNPTGQVTGQATGQVDSQNNRINALLEYCKEPRTREEMQDYIGISDRKHFRKYYLYPLLDSNKLIMIIPDKPNSRMQKYVKNEQFNLYGTTQDTIQVKNREVAILNYCKVPRTREEIQDFIELKDKSYFREYILKPLLDSNKLGMTIPNKPNSRMQKYVKIKK